MNKFFTSHAASSAADDNKNRKKSLLKFGILAFLALLVWIFSTIAWFAMNDSVGANGMSVGVAEIPFEIAASGTNGVRNQSIIQQVASEFLPGSSYTFGNVTYSKTGSGTDCLRLQYTTGESEIGPGGSGVCDLYVIPKRDGDLSVNISMNLIPYAYAEVYVLDNDGNKVQSTVVQQDEHGDPVTDEHGDPVIVPLTDNNGAPIYDTTRTLLLVSDINTTDCDITNEELEKIQAAARFVQGHILFFEEEGELPATNDEEYDDNYYYKKPIINRSFTYTEENADEGEPFYVPIRWMWPNTLGQLALQTNANELRSGIPVVHQEVATSSNDKGKILTYLKTNQSSIFKGIDHTKLSSAQQTEYAALATDAQKQAYLESAVNAWIDAADVPDNFEILSSGYNSADYSIGSNIAYFLIELTVTSGEAE